MGVKTEDVSILSQADRLINGPRAAEYGDASVQFAKAGEMVENMLNKDELARLARGIIPASVVCKVQIATKLTREAHKPKKDNRVDACGYLGLLDKIVGA